MRSVLNIIKLSKDKLKSWGSNLDIALIIFQYYIQGPNALKILIFIKYVLKR